MTKAKYVRALRSLLIPQGFIGEKDSWERVEGDLRARISYCSIPTLGVTPEYQMTDIRTEKLFLEIFPAWPQLPLYAHRIGILTKTLTPWWDRKDPEGPTQMATAVREQILPWLDRPWPLEVQAREWFHREKAMESRGYGGPIFICLVLTLHRMGEFDEVSALLNKPIPRTAIQSNVEMIAKVRDYLGYS